MKKNKKITPIVIGLDFDGSCVTHDFPKIGKDIGAIPVLKKLVDNGHKLILFTMRSDKKEVFSDHFEIHGIASNYLTQAVNWFKENDIPLYGIQTNPTQKEWTDSPKAYCQLMIDDVGIGCPLKFDSELSDRHFIDWKGVECLLINMNVI